MEILTGPQAGTVVRIQETVTLGTAAESQVVIEDSTVSRRHALLERGPAGLWVRDLSSKNGTFVNGLRVQGLLVRREATFTIGSTVIRVFATIPEAAPRSTAFGEAVGASASMQSLFETLRRTAPTSSSILLMGETGTGKDVLARAIHSVSPRRHRPFIVLDCSTLAPNLIESELFGHAKGSFTGAHTERLGAFLSADGGTLFLDEVGELPKDLQPRLLRVLESRTIRRVGEDKDRSIDIRLIAATHRDLNALRKSGQFRDDLYYRLAVVVAKIPPLRERREDLPLLVQAILANAGRPELPLSTDVMDLLEHHDWPGNVRELKNLVERALMGERVQALLPDKAAKETTEPDLPFKEAKDQILESFIRSYFTKLYELHKGNISEMARTAKIARTYASEMVRKLGLK